MPRQNRRRYASIVFVQTNNSLFAWSCWYSKGHGIRSVGLEVVISGGGGQICITSTNNWWCSRTYKCVWSPNDMVQLERSCPVVRDMDSVRLGDVLTPNSIYRSKFMQWESRQFHKGQFHRTWRYWNSRWVEHDYEMNSSSTRCDEY
jgi:hypothetical protein